MVVRIISGQDLSSSKASYTCELSLWRLNLGEHVEVVNETVTSAAADGLIPTWNQTFTFGQHVDLASVDMLKIRVFKGSGRHSLFGKKEKGEAILPLVMFSKIETTTKLEPKWHTLQKVHKMKSIRGQMQIAVEWRPAGEFVQGQVSNVQHHGFGALNIDHLPRELKALFKLTIKNVMSKVESFREKKIIEEIKIKEEEEKKKGTTTTTTTTNPGETKTSALPSPLGIDIETIEQIYRSRMKTFLFKAIPITTKSHHYKDSIQGDKSSAKKRSKKLKKDCKKNCVTLQFFLYYYPVQFYNSNISSIE